MGVQPPPHAHSLLGGFSLRCFSLPSSRPEPMACRGIRTGQLDISSRRLTPSAPLPTSVPSMSSYLFVPPCFLQPDGRTCRSTAFCRTANKSWRGSSAPTSSGSRRTTTRGTSSPRLRACSTLTAPLRWGCHRQSEDVRCVHCGVCVFRVCYGLCAAVVSTNM